jgi:hypothetical protein
VARAPHEGSGPPPPRQGRRLLHARRDDELLRRRECVAAAGSFVLVHGGTTHDFENRTGERAGFLDVSVPGEFEPAMPAIAEWFRTRSPSDAAC